VYLAWLTPPAFGPGDEDAELVARILGGGKSSRLYRKLVYEQQIAQDAACTHQSLALASTLECTITARPGVKPDKLEGAAEREIESLVGSGPTQAEVDRARNAKETEMIRDLERVGGFGGVADTLNYYNQYLGDPGYLPEDIARYENATVASIQRLAKSALSANRRVVVYGIPGQKIVDDVPRSAADTDATVKIEPEHPPAFEQQEAWRATPPKAGPLRKLSLPEPSEATLKNGLRIKVVENHSLPILAVRFVTFGGGEAQDPRQAGLAGFAAAMLTEGTAHRTAPQIADDTDQIGASLDKGAQPDYAFVSVNALSNATRPAMDLLSDVAVHPAFNAKEVERIRKERLTSLLQLKDQPVDLATFVGYRALYGPSSDYGYTDLGTDQVLSALTRDDLLRFWSKHYGPANSALVFAGDVTPSQAHALAEEFFGQWQGSGEPSHPPEPPAKPARKIVMVDQPGAPQSTIMAMGVGLPRSSADYVPVLVMNTILGDLFSSRINMNLRERNGFTYGAFSRFDFRRGAGPMFAGAQVRTDVTAPAVKELFYELDRVRSSPLSAEEIRMGKDYVVRSLPGRFETNNSTADRISELWAYDLPSDYFRELPARIEAVTPDQTTMVAQKYVHPENMLLVTVGDKEKIARGLEELKIGTVELWNSDAQPVSVRSKKPEH
jgi:zinc protease